MNAKPAKTKSSQNKKSQVKLQDLKPKEDAEGGISENQGPKGLGSNTGLGS